MANFGRSQGCKLKTTAGAGREKGKGGVGKTRKTGTRGKNQDLSADVGKKTNQEKGGKRQERQPCEEAANSSHGVVARHKKGKN